MAEKGLIGRLKVYGGFALEVVGGLIVFVLIFLPALLLDMCLTALGHAHMASDGLIHIAKGAKLAFLYFDLTLGALFLAAHLVKFCRLLLDDIRG